MKKSAILGTLASLGLLSAASAASLFGVTDDNRLVSLDISVPATFNSSVAITGLFDADGITLNPNGSIVNLTYNPMNGKLYGIDNNANFYQINLGGVATLVSAGFSPAGFSSGLAYDPFSSNFVYVDVDDAAGNYTITPSGVVTSNPNFTYAGGGTPSIFALAIDPDFSTPYTLDSQTDSLAVSTDPLFPQGSELNVVGSLGIDVTSFGGLVANWDGTLYAALSTDGLTSGLYSIDSVTGLATSLGSFGGVGIASLAIPEPSITLLGGLGVLFLFRRRA
ncbi:MAG: DUF4394 domain-containing protein [Akkermansiaceae bacterium]